MGENGRRWINQWVPTGCGLPSHDDLRRGQHWVTSYCIDNEHRLASRDGEYWTIKGVGVTCWSVDGRQKNSVTMSDYCLSCFIMCQVHTEVREQFILVPAEGVSQRGRSLIFKS